MDAIELIANQIAIVSHCQEIINDLRLDYSTETDITNKENLIKEISNQELIKNQANSMRRNIMENIKREFENSNDKLWCTTKHAIASYMFAVEVASANNSIERDEFQAQAYVQLIQVLSLFL
jgi:hypothetical protein